MTVDHVTAAVLVFLAVSVLLAHRAPRVWERTGARYVYGPAARAVTGGWLALVGRVRDRVGVTRP